MINKDQVEKIANDTASTVTEVIQSAAAVRGEHFANIVSCIFSFHAMSKGLAIMVSMSNDKAYAEDLAYKLLTVIAQASSTMLDTIETDELQEEARNMAISLADRVDEAERRING